jgi:hypothetical protein
VTWQPRYVAYAKAHGRTADEQHAHDDATDSFWKFSLWISQQMCEAEKAGHPCVERWFYTGLQIASQEKWDEWLNRPDATKLVER